VWCNVFFFLCVFGVGDVVVRDINVIVAYLLLVLFVDL
jgi:hypothetical protein